MADKLFETRQAITFMVKLPGMPRAVAFPAVPGRINAMPEEVWRHLLELKDSGGAAPLVRYLEAGIIVDVTAKIAQATVEGAIPFVPVIVPPPLQVAAEVFASTVAENKDAPDVEAAVAAANARAREAAARVPVVEPARGPKRKRVHGIAGDEEDFEAPPGPGR